MSSTDRLPFPRWTVAVPPLAVVVLAATWGSKPPGVVLALVGAFLACNGIVGASLLVATLRRRFAEFNAEGTATALATVSTLATLCLVLPTFTTSRPGPEFSGAQLAFAAVASLALYGLFVFVQTVRHRDSRRAASTSCSSRRSCSSP